MAMRIRTIEELRALVGAAGNDLTDAQLLGLADATRGHALILAGAWRDLRDPDGARRRTRIHLLREHERLAPRRARYARERDAKRWRSA